MLILKGPGGGQGHRDHASRPPREPEARWDGAHGTEM